MKKSNSLISIRRCEIVSRLKDDDGNDILTLDSVKNVLASKAHTIKDYALIIHDKDRFDETTDKHNKGDLKPPHIHMLLRFYDNQVQTISKVASWFNLSSNFVEKIKGRWVDALAYLIHLNAPEKHQYPVSDIQANFDVEAVLATYKQQDDLETILQDIINGKIREYNKTSLIDPMILIKYADKIREAFKIRSEMLAATRKDRNTEVIYISGESGSGKTTLAKKLCRDRKMDFFISSGSNDILDGYGGEPCLIIDDARPTSMGMSDLLKLLDNHTASSIKSRYRNRYLNCELIMITTTLSIDDFYNGIYGNETESIIQLKRRCGIYIQMNRFHIKVSVWDSILNKYFTVVIYDNTLLDTFKVSETEKLEHRTDEIKNALSFLNKSAPVQTEAAASMDTISEFHLRPQKTLELSNILADDNIDSLLDG